LPWNVALPCIHPLTVVLAETSALSSPCDASTAIGLLVNRNTPNGFTSSASFAVSFPAMSEPNLVCQPFALLIVATRVPPRSVRAAQHPGRPLLAQQSMSGEPTVNDATVTLCPVSSGCSPPPQTLSPVVPRVQWVVTYVDKNAEGLADEGGDVNTIALGGHPR
jgi:hypothetical protein